MMSTPIITLLLVGSMEFLGYFHRDARGTARRFPAMGNSRHGFLLLGGCRRHGFAPVTEGGGCNLGQAGHGHQAALSWVSSSCTISRILATALAFIRW